MPKDTNKEVMEALVAAQRLFTYALPKFNWGASALDAEAITLLNTVPKQVNDAIASLEHEPMTPEAEHWKKLALGQSVELERAKQLIATLDRSLSTITAVINNIAATRKG